MDLAEQGAYAIQRVRGAAFRKRVAQYIADNHYTRSNGGSGQLFAVLRGGEVAGACLVGATASENQKRSIVAGACLIGPAPSEDAERSVVRQGVLVRQIKRSHLLDSVPTAAMFESHLLRHCMREVCNEYDAPMVFVSYADPAAADSRTGLPMSGSCYLAAGFFFIGYTTSQRWCLIDHLGRARSTRQGNVTLSRRTLPRAGESFHGELITADWRREKLPPARIWIAVTTPTRFTKRQARRSWRAVWAALNPARRVAARIWLSHVAWRRQLASGIVPLGDPRPQHLRPLDRFQPAWWPGDCVTRTAAPVWVPLVYQQRTLLLDDVIGETVGGRVYAPLQI